MAVLALRRESARSMIRVCGAIKVTGMAIGAGLGQSGETAADVASRALNSGMFAHQGELRASIVVKGGTLPVGCRVALCTILREPGLDVVRLLGRGEVL